MTLTDNHPVSPLCDGQVESRGGSGEEAGEVQGSDDSSGQGKKEEGNAGE